jgi:hypothetical protein
MKITHQTSSQNFIDLALIFLETLLIRKITRSYIHLGINIYPNEIGENPFSQLPILN